MIYEDKIPGQGGRVDVSPDPSSIVKGPLEVELDSSKSRGYHGWTGHPGGY